MTLNLTIPQQMHTDFTPRITVIGVGGGGTNAVDNMIAMSLQGVQFVVANTDAQQLMHSRADTRIQLGPHLTQGLGAGAKPEIGRAAAEEAADEVYRHLEGAHMVFITAGMGGGTGTGAAPVIARMARERGILTVGVVTKPFSFEGTRRARAADQGIEELQQYVDTLIVIPNQNLFRLANERTGWKEAFKMADNVLYMGVRGVTDLMMAPGLVNLDFADIRTVMAEMGKAMMGTGEADGENRAIRAAEAAISNPLLEDTSMAGARGLLINITGGEDMTLFEVDQAANRIREEVDEEANIIFGSAIDDGLSGRIRVSVVATGIDAAQQSDQRGPRLVAVGGGAPIPMPMPMAQQAAPAPLPFPRAVQPAAQPVAQAVTQVAPQPLAQPAMAGVAEMMQAEPAQASLLAPEAAPVQPVGRAQPVMAEAPQPVMAEMQQPVHMQQPMHAQQAYATAPQAQPVPQPAMHRAPPAVAPMAHAPVQAPAAEAAAPRGLFAAPNRAAQQTAPAAPAEPRQSLFSKVTGAFRRNAPADQALEAARPTQMPPQAYAQPRAEAAAEPVRAQVRPAGGEEMGLDIPAFLRRQN